MGVESFDNFSSKYLLFWVIEVRLAVINMLLTCRNTHYHVFSMVINIVFITAKLVTFYQKCSQKLFKTGVTTI